MTIKSNEPLKYNALNVQKINSVIKIAKPITFPKVKCPMVSNNIEMPANINVTGEKLSSSTMKHPDRL